MGEAEVETRTMFKVSTVLSMAMALWLAACAGSSGEGVGTGRSGLEGDDKDPPKACPAVMIDCVEGYVAADSDGDGCIDSCQPKTTSEPGGGCRVAILCVEGFEPIDADGDGCVDACGQTAAK
jgi:hypothetical protein